MRVATKNDVLQDTATPVLVSWSGGKDSCMALHAVQHDARYRVEALLTTITGELDRISMHGVRRVLLEQQAAALGLPLEQVILTKGAPNTEYEAKIGAAFDAYRARGVDNVVFGDLFLEDIKAYRDKFLAKHHMTPVYPVWTRDTAEFMRRFLDLGFKTAVVCVDPKKLPQSFVGRVIDAQFLADLPANVDPGGENGEFHTFVFDGPNFEKPVKFEFGEVIERDSFWFRDLIPTV